MGWSAWVPRDLQVPIQSLAERLVSPIQPAAPLASREAGATAALETASEVQNEMAHLVLRRKSALRQR